MTNSNDYRLDGNNNVIYDINVTFTPNFFNEFESAGFQYDFMRLTDDLGVLRLSEETYSQGLENILALRSVISIERTVRMAPLSKVSLGVENGIVATEEIGVNYFKNNPNISITGRGVIIAVADSGIDYLHPDFIYPDGTSKILYLWDQTKDGIPPEGFYFGTEYTREDINRAIQNNDSSLSQDEIGRGTMISGICAGMGNVNPEYAGVAYEADLIIVKLATLEGFYNNAMLFASTEYAYRKSRQLRRPIVINISYGSNNLIGLTNINTTRYYERGYCEVAGAGDEGDTQTHTTGRLQFNGDTASVEIELNEDEEDLTIDVWVQRPDLIELEVVSPSGEITRGVSAYYNYLEVRGLLDLEGTYYTITSRYPTTVSGQQFIQIYLRNVVRGIWTIRLTGINIINGRYNIYLPNRIFINSGTRFRNSVPSYTINYPAIREEIITVGAYNSLNRSLWNSSSRGPTIQNWAKPDIIAPGVNIIAPLPGNTYGTITGTGASAAHVSGAAALFFQYTLVDGNYYNQGYLSNFKTFIKLGADRSLNIVYPNYSYGYGVLNVRRMFDFFR
ncbi:S8 family peptidase [Metaclostridioides mangenotii]|uniref:Subtilisin family serine protease n=2 Tax=Metaclostridioides mangenotii TaxID=1540 RepID=A0ABS4E948_9FIRM|nr:S8 family peptidase [Clostridioides mangenotii]MBP1854447.1 subtilisin family serine protease [Clostridioides mangenotii]